MKVYLLNYSDDRFKHKGGCFRENQNALNASAKQFQINDIASWTWDDLVKTNFYREHKEYLDKNRYHNGNAFKPYIILKLLEEIEPGDVVFYYDCGKNPIRTSIQPLVDLCLKNGGTLFHEWGDQNRNWTKRDAFVYMDCDTPRFHNAVALQNTWLFLQKNEFSIQFTKEWLKYNLDERIASYVKPDTCGLPPLKGFVENRGDQSIFSNLAVKYRIKTFFGRGGRRNRDVNNFIACLPKNAVDEVISCLKQIRIKWKRKHELRRSPKDQLSAAIAPEMRS